MTTFVLSFCVIIIAAILASPVEKMEREGNNAKNRINREKTNQVTYSERGKTSLYGEFISEEKKHNDFLDFSGGSMGI